MLMRKKFLKERLTRQKNLMLLIVSIAINKVRSMVGMIMTIMVMEIIMPTTMEVDKIMKICIHEVVMTKKIIIL